MKKTQELEMNILKATAANGPNTNNTKADASATTSVNKSKVNCGFNCKLVWMIDAP